MKTSTLASLAALFLFNSVVTANFDLFSGYYAYIAGEFSHERPMWQVFASDPDCNTVYNTPNYRDLQDVSGTKIGVRCEGYGCSSSADPSTIDTLEMHFDNNPLWHWTIYKNRGSYEMIGLDGRVYGHCDPFPGDDYFCSTVFETYFGDRKFRCYTQFTADQINFS